MCRNRHKNTVIVGLHKLEKVQSVKMQTYTDPTIVSINDAQTLNSANVTNTPAKLYNKNLCHIWFRKQLYCLRHGCKFSND